MSEPLLDINLTPEERQVLIAGLHVWGGVARATDAVAQFIGFTNERDVSVHGGYLAIVLSLGESLTWDDWKRAQLATEIAFGSDRVGAGVEWSIVTGLTDEETIPLLRSLQRKILSAHPES